MTDKLIEIIFTAITAALAAYFFNFIQWINSERWKKFDEDKKILLSVIGNLRLTSVKYWSKKYEDNTEKILDESSIKQELKILDRIMRTYCSSYNDSFLVSDVVFLSNFSSLCYDLITGDDFESSEKDEDVSKCKRISTVMTKAYIIIHTNSMDISPWWYKINK